MSVSSQVQPQNAFLRLRESLAHIAFAIAKALIRLRMTSWFIFRIAQTKFGMLLVVTIVSNTDSHSRAYYIKAAQKLHASRAHWDAVIETAKGQAKRWNFERGYVEALVLALIGAQRFRELIDLLENVKNTLAPKSSIVRSALTYARFEMGDFRGTVAASIESFKADPKAARNGSDCLYGAYAASQLQNFPRAIRLFCAHYNLATSLPLEIESDSAIEPLWEILADEIFSRLRLYINVSLKGQNVGVFFLSSTTALGHSILDPYHFLALYRGKFDRVIFVGPPIDWYQKPPATCLQILTQYGEYVQTTDQMLINLSWMNFGEFEFEKFHLVIKNYWGLLREATHRSHDKCDPFKHNSWHMALPKRFKAEGNKFAARHKIDLTRPIITLHAREINYHNIVKQSYRDVDIADYKPAIQYLIDRGFQVIRIGDLSMKPLHIDSHDYMELPFLKGYNHVLDSFFISKSTFMIGCQSGPCAFARALGIPLLTVNAVFHYSLLPTTKEMALFKHYVFCDSDAKYYELGLEECLEKNLFWYENSIQFEKNKIQVRSATAAEIEFATKDMIAWLENPLLPMTDDQKQFSDFALRANRRIGSSPDSLPVANYLGISLPGYRVAPHRQKILDF